MERIFTFAIQPAGPFSLAASVRFVEGFTPAGYERRAGPELTLAFPVDGDWRSVAVMLHQDSAGTIRGEMVGAADVEAVQAQVGRILSLDVDGTGFTAVRERDPEVGRLQDRYPGLRPVTFWSPYEAAAWAVISQRIRIVEAARIKAEIAARLGETLEIGGHPLHAFPSPARLAELESFPGLFGRKVEWLRGLGLTALEGKLGAQYLRSMPAEQALSELMAIRGLGPFAAELVLLRGAGHPDWPPTHEQRLVRAVQVRYRLRRPPSVDELRRLAEPWRPYRTWVCVLLRSWLEDQTGEIAGRSLGAN